VYNVVWTRYQICGDMSHAMLNNINIRNQCLVPLQAGAEGTIWWDGIEYRSEFTELRNWFTFRVVPRMNNVLATRPAP
jgi:hypothetical protein